MAPSTIDFLFEFEKTLQKYNDQFGKIRQIRPPRFSTFLTWRITINLLFHF